MGAAVVTVLPWVVWQTRATMRLEIQMETLVKIESKLDVMLTMSSKIDTLERRITIAEEDLGSRQGQRFNKPDFEKYVKPILDDHAQRIRQLEIQAAR